ncbi:hypothetical protein KW796_02265 [Candidatus Parcubacteria bacterium]|nr:hypothetical protein [Candidatus Parcubacteria bacterium]
MYKLLTPAGIEKVRKEYAFRRIGAGLGLFALLLAFTALALLPSLVIAKGKRDAAVLALSSSATAVSIDKDELSEWAAGIRSTLKVLASADPDRPYEYFRSVLSVKSAGIKITDFYWQRSAGASIIKIKGVAKDRQSLLLFKSDLDTLDSFGSAEFPVDNLAKDANIDFEISLTISS